ncbi:MAG: AcvB/VirJ family lysyl-phosphatidylglycerol hydrolase [Bryobacteraceae bacterium]
MSLALALLLTGQLAAADTTTIRGHTVPLAQLPSNTGQAAVAVIFLPGDGGWRGTAITIARNIGSWGLDVFGFDTKKYLEAFSANGETLSAQDMASDVRTVADRVSGTSHRPVVLVGWSQGASMAVAAAAGLQSRTPIRGVITLGLPESGVLGWDWKATLAVVAHREPDQPAFAVKPLLSSSAPVPLWLIHGTEDEYTALSAARALFRCAGEPKHMEEINGANHRFEGHQSELYQALQRGLAWIASH